MWNVKKIKPIQYKKVFERHWKFQLLAPSRSWDCYLKIWAKYLIGTKICHFEFTFSLITSGLKDLSSWNLVQASFLVWEVQKSQKVTKSPKTIQEYTRTHQCSVISHIKFSLSSTWSRTGKVCDTTIIKKKIFFRNKDINLTFCQNWGWILF